MTQQNFDGYFDYAATTPPDPRVIDAMIDALTHYWGNCGSPHIFGQKAEEKVEAALVKIAQFFNIDRDELIITSGATESINQAIKGVAHAGKKRHIITSTIEHKATLQTVQALLKEGYRATFIAPNEAGVITAEMVEAAIEEDTAIISLIWINNETGDSLPVEAIATIARKYKIPFHVDATQAVPHFTIDASQFDLMSMSAHKFYGPKGVGMLYRRNFPRLPIQPLMDGSGGQLGIRSGTRPNELIIGMAKALEICGAEFSTSAPKYATYRHNLLKALSLYGVTQNSRFEQRIDATLNLHMPHIHTDALMTALPTMAMAKGSACSSDSALPSHVLTELGYSARHALQSIRLSFGRYTTEKGLNELIEQCHHVIPLLQKIAMGEVVDERDNVQLLKTMATQLGDDSFEPTYFIDPSNRYDSTQKGASITIDQPDLRVDICWNIDNGLIDRVESSIMGAPYFIMAVNRLTAILRNLPVAELKTLSLEAMMGVVPPAHLQSLLTIERQLHAIE